ncbi:hypothetical protein Angca_007538, partial [Angiostrongylus cantonensis]
QLSYWMAKLAPAASFLLIDRSGSRNKYDNKALQENPSLNMKRLRCSIEHLDLSEVEMLNLCAVCKHFCGSATDAGIRCLSNGIEGGLALDGFLLVPCCHHKSRYTEYCGHDFLEKWNMNSESDFAALRHISAWAVSGITKTHFRSPKWKEKLGRCAKVVLEAGRSRHLALLGFSTRVIEYVSPSITPENLLILGIR